MDIDVLDCSILGILSGRISLRDSLVASFENARRSSFDYHQLKEISVV